MKRNILSLGFLSFLFCYPWEITEIFLFKGTAVVIFDSRLTSGKKKKTFSIKSTRFLIEAIRFEIKQISQEKI